MIVRRYFSDNILSNYIHKSNASSEKVVNLQKSKFCRRSVPNSFSDRPDSILDILSSANQVSG